MKPTLVGPYGKAWRYDQDAMAKKYHRVGKHASVVSWLIEAPWANMLWHSYALHIIHLRQISGLPPLKRYLEDGTHEIELFALHPDWKLSIEEAPQHLQPINFAAQFIAESDEAAATRAEVAVQEILAGDLSPDTDWMQAWITRFGANMLKGDARTAGETIIKMDHVGGKIEELKFDPKSPEQKPRDRLCSKCGQPASPLAPLCFTCLRSSTV